MAAPGGSPTAQAVVTLPTVSDEPAIEVEVGNQRVVFTDVRRLNLEWADPESAPWLPRLPLPDELFAAQGTDGSVWLADVAAGVMRRMAPELGVGARLLDLHAPTQRLLVTDGSLLTALGPGGELVAQLLGLSHGAFLADASVAVMGPTGRGRGIGVWSPEAQTVNWEGMPSGFDDWIVAVGSRVVVGGEDGPVLVDPHTGERIGDVWRGGEREETAGSPDGSRFVISPLLDGAPSSAIELRDAETGDVLARTQGEALTNVETLAWLTDEIILVLRAPTGTDVEAGLELQRADGVFGPPVQLDSPVGRPLLIAARGQRFLLVGEYGEVILARVESIR